MLGLALRRGLRVEGVAVVGHFSVGETDDAGRVALREIGVVRHHDDETVLSDLLEEVHDLHGRCRVEGSGRLVGEHDLGVVHEGAGDRHALHLAARKLARTLVHVLGQTDAVEGGEGALAPFRARDAGQRERELHVREHGLVRDEVVALEHEADAVVAVGVPVTVAILLRGDAVDEKVARVKVVEAADDVEHRGLARPRRAEDGHELVVPERDGDAVKRRLRERRRDVLLADVPELEHAVPSDDLFQW